MAASENDPEALGAGWSCAWPAPGKLNLFFHLTGRDAHGNDRRQTLLQFLDHGDALAFRVRSDGAIAAAFGDGDGDAAAPALGAAAALQRYEGARAGADIAVTEQVPGDAGLGRASSDAATTLVALNHLWGCGLSRDQLASVGHTLGPDVAFFVHGRAAWAEGTGDELTAVEPREPWYLVIVPPVDASTPCVLEAPELTRDHPPITIRDFLAGGAGNDCLAAVRERYPQVGEALDWLSAHRTVPRLCATGASVFAAFGDETNARELAAAVPEPWRAFVARGRNRSPLHTRLAALEAA